VVADAWREGSALGGSPEQAFSKESVQVHNPRVDYEFEETNLNLNDTVKFKSNGLMPI
jgi:hypothetical protein